MTSAAPEYLLGIHNFHGRSEDELDIARGDYVEVLEDDSAFNDTWYIGRNLRTYATGLFPRPFTVAVTALPPDVAVLAARAPPIALVDDTSSPRESPLSASPPAPTAPSPAPVVASEIDKAILAMEAAPAPAQVLSWSPAQVAAHFAARGIVEAPQFTAHRITGAILLEMDRETLKEIDIASFGPRFEIEREIRALRQQLGLPAAAPHSPLSPQSVVPAGPPSPATWASPAGNPSFAASSPNFGVISPNFTNLPTFAPPAEQSWAGQSEEELTGSLGSNFGARRGHHRHASSLSSRYSMANVPRGSTDEWESGLQPALVEHRAGDSHRRNPSRGVDWDAKKAHRNSVLSLLSVSPKKSMQHLTGTPTVASPSQPPAHLPPTPSAAPSAVSSTVSSNSSTQTPKDTLQLLNGQVLSNGQPYAAVMTNSGNQHSQNTSHGALKAMIRPGAQKHVTSAFQEGIQHTTALQAAQTADKAGWLHKRGGSGLGVWSKRYFTLHGTRLSYFATFKDTKERGLIDITGHRVVPVKDKDLLVSVSAAGMGAGRYCFKLVPPGPGYRKGVAFTAPRVHYFAADSEQEMRDWQTHLLTATIERDESAPVTSTCKLPTMSLPRAQELMAERLRTKGDVGSLTN